MKQILVISGKGGTGKTTLVAALADLTSKEMKLVLVDADVDAANLELMLDPDHEQMFIFKAGRTALIDQALCSQCGCCAEVCRFEAVYKKEGAFFIDAAMCEGCASCFYQCPAGAIRIEVRTSGEWYRSSTPYGKLFHASLHPGEENSGKLVTQIKHAAARQAEEENADLMLIDGPPGIGCPITAACRGADLAVLVSEPTISGKHDLARILEVTDHFGIPAYLVLNKSDLNPLMREEIVSLSQSAGAPLLGEIPYDERIMAAQSQAVPVTKALDEELSKYFEEIWLQLKAKIGIF